MSSRPSTARGTGSSAAAAEIEQEKEVPERPKNILHTYPLIRQSDMSDDMKAETVELIVTACEKHSSNNENAARMVKEEMDRKYGSSWHVVVGEGFGFDISFESKNMLYLFFGGNLGICVWKCS